MDNLLSLPSGAYSPFKSFELDSLLSAPSKAHSPLKSFDLDHLLSTTSKAAESIKDHFGRLAATPNVDFKEHIENIISKVHPLFKEHFARYADAFNVDDIKDRLARITNPFGARVSDSQSEFANNDDQQSDAFQEFNRQFSKNFDAIVRARSSNQESDSSAPEACRKRRSTDEPQQQNENRKYPVLEVKENPISYETVKNPKEFSKTHVESQSPKSIHHMPAVRTDIYETKKCLHCHKYGSQLSDSVCRSCGEKRPQYIEYIQGKAVAYYPGMKRKTSKKSSTQKRYIFDRYGHKYLESKGNLRLLKPQQQKEVKN